ncbi:hypothetical protein C8R45DRAFT_548955 [Mycena sanguinolenta]|nr:hypothetical protein C8R45DRAFT_548955 [Mycena sanguinolenta]
MGVRGCEVSIRRRREAHARTGEFHHDSADGLPSQAHTHCAPPTHARRRGLPRTLTSARWVTCVESTLPNPRTRASASQIRLDKYARYWRAGFTARWRTEINWRLGFRFLLCPLLVFQVLSLRAGERRRGEVARPRLCFVRRARAPGTQTGAVVAADACMHPDAARPCVISPALTLILLLLRVFFRSETECGVCRRKEDGSSDREDRSWGIHFSFPPGAELCRMGLLDGIHLSLFPRSRSARAHDRLLALGPALRCCSVSPLMLCFFFLWLLREARGRPPDPCFECRRSSYLPFHPFIRIYVVSWVLRYKS